MSAFDRRVAEPPHRRHFLARLREPDVVRAALVALVAGLVGGFFGFWVGSSRGFDNIDLAGFVTAISAVILLVMVVLGIARALWADDLRVAAAAVTLVVAAWLGSSAAFATLPGNTTDGLMLVTVGPPTEERPGGQLVDAKCTWDRAAGQVTTVESRRSLPAAPHAAVTIYVELGAGGLPASLAMEALEPVSFVPVARYTASGTALLAQPTGQGGALRVTDLGISTPDTSAADPALAQFVRAQLAELGAEDVVAVEWDCPRLP